MGACLQEKCRGIATISPSRSLGSKVGGKESTNGLRFHFKKEGFSYDLTAKIFLEVIRSAINCIDANKKLWP